MGAYNLIVNTSFLIDLPADFSDNGWSISGSKATHAEPNPGYIVLRQSGLEPNTAYVIEYEVTNYVSGIVQLIAGGTEGIERSANGIYSELITTGDDGILKFYADGVVTLEYLNFYDSATDTDNSLTLAFNETANKFVTYLSYKPELMIKFIDGFYTSKEGELWIHNFNEIRNNFYGEQYTSQLVFWVNTNPTEVKDYLSLREKSNKVWSLVEAEILPVYGKPNGQRTRLKRGRFKNLLGDFFADFMKDMNDPRFATELDALTKGADIQGSLMKVTFENIDTTEVRLLSIDFLGSPHDYTY